MLIIIQTLIFIYELFTHRGREKEREREEKKIYSLRKNNNNREIQISMYTTDLYVFISITIYETFKTTIILCDMYKCKIK